MNSKLAELLQKRRQQQEEAEQRDEGYFTCDTEAPKRTTSDQVETPSSAPNINERMSSGKASCVSVEDAKNVMRKAASLGNESSSAIFRETSPEPARNLPKISPTLESQTSDSVFSLHDSSVTDEYKDTAMQSLPEEQNTQSDFRMPAATLSKVASVHSNLGTGSLFKRPTPAELLRGSVSKRKSDHPGTVAFSVQEETKVVLQEGKNAISSLEAGTDTRMNQKAFESSDAAVRKKDSREGFNSIPIMNTAQSEESGSVTKLQGAYSCDIHVNKTYGEVLERTKDTLTERNIILEELKPNQSPPIAVPSPSSAPQNFDQITSKQPPIHPDSQRKILSNSTLAPTTASNRKAEIVDLNTIQIGMLGTIEEADELELDEEGKEISGHRKSQGPHSGIRPPKSNSKAPDIVSCPSNSMEIASSPLSKPSVSAQPKEMEELDQQTSKKSPDSLLRNFASEFSGVLQQHLQGQKENSSSTLQLSEITEETDALENARDNDISRLQSSEKQQSFKMTAVVVPRSLSMEEDIRADQNSNSKIEEGDDQETRAPLSNTSQKQFRWAGMATERTKSIAKLLDSADDRGDDYIDLQLKKGVQDVLQWLRDSGWSQYEEMFALNQIDFNELFTLEEQDLIDMGMKRAENRTLLLNSINGLRGVVPTPNSNKHDPPMKEKVPEKVWVKGSRDKDAEQNASLLASKTDYKQKHGSVTWRLESSKEWKRGFCVIQGTVMAIFERSDYIVHKPEISCRLPGSLFKNDPDIENGIYIQINPTGKGSSDVRLVSKTAEDRDDWMQHLVAAAHLSVLDPNAPAILQEKQIAQASAVLLLIQEMVINNSGPLEDGFLSVSLTTSQCIPVQRFDKIPMPLKVMMPDHQGVISATFRTHTLLGAQLLKAAGKDPLLFFEFCHTERSRIASAHVQLQYWAFTPLEAAHSGTIILPLMKRPLVMDPEGLKKQLPMKRKSYITFRKEVKTQSVSGPQSSDAPLSNIPSQPLTNASAISSSGSTTSVSAPASTGSEQRKSDSGDDFIQNTNNSARPLKNGANPPSLTSKSRVDLEKIMRNKRVSVQVREAANTLMQFLAQDSSDSCEIEVETSSVSSGSVSQTSSRASTGTSTTATESEKSARSTPPVSMTLSKETPSEAPKTGPKTGAPMSATRKAIAVDQRYVNELGKRGAPLWGNCYGALGEPTKGQKHGWLVLVLEGKKDMRLYGKCSRNTLLLFQSPDYMETAIKSICLDGALISQNTGRRQFGIEIMKSMFGSRQDDFFVAADSQKEADAWERALFKCTLWNAKQNQLAHAYNDGETEAKAPMTTTPEEIARMNENIKKANAGGAANTFDPRSIAPKSMPRLIKGEEMEIRFSQLNYEILRKGETYVKPTIACYWVGYEGSRFITPEIAGREVEISFSGQGLPGILTIESSRTYSLSPNMQKASNVCLYFEFRHQKPKKVSIRAWTFLPITKMRIGDYNLIMYEKPVVYGPKAEKADIMKGFQLALSIGPTT